jgi:hypothetical protein
MTMGSFSKKRNYTKSNKILSVDTYISRYARQLTSKLLESQETTQRQSLASSILEELSKLAEISSVRVTISDAKQWHKKYNGKVAFKQYGYYKPGKKYIYITNRTAVRGQILAPKTFLDTLLHEWLHHYDTERLKLDSIHTAGFYARLKDLKEKIGYFDY